MAIDKTEDITLINDILKESVKAPFNEKLGVKLIEAQKGRAVLELDAKQGLTNGLGIIHGGVTASLCDNAMGFAAMTLGIIPVTVEMKLNFLSPGSIEGTLVAKGRIVKEGRTLIIGEGEVYNGDKLIAKSLGTYFAQKSEKALSQNKI